MDIFFLFGSRFVSCFLTQLTNLVFQPVRQYHCPCSSEEVGLTSGTESNARFIQHGGQGGSFRGAASGIGRHGRRRRGIQYATSEDGRHKGWRRSPGVLFDRYGRCEARCWAVEVSLIAATEPTTAVPPTAETSARSPVAMLSALEGASCGSIACEGRGCGRCGSAGRLSRFNDGGGGDDGDFGAHFGSVHWCDT